MLAVSCSANIEIGWAFQQAASHRCLKSIRLGIEPIRNPEHVYCHARISFAARAPGINDFRNIFGIWYTGIWRACASYSHDRGHIKLCWYISSPSLFSRYSKHIYALWLRTAFFFLFDILMTRQQLVPFDTLLFSFIFLCSTHSHCCFAVILTFYWYECTNWYKTHILNSTYIHTYIQVNASY